MTKPNSPKTVAKKFTNILAKTTPSNAKVRQLSKDFVGLMAAATLVKMKNKRR